MYIKKKDEPVAVKPLVANSKTLEPKPAGLGSLLSAYDDDEDASD